MPPLKTEVRLRDACIYCFSKVRNAWVPEVTRENAGTADFAWGGEGRLRGEAYWVRRTPGEEPDEMMD